MSFPKGGWLSVLNIKLCQRIASFSCYCLTNVVKERIEEELIMLIVALLLSLL